MPHAGPRKRADGERCRCVRCAASAEGSGPSRHGRALPAPNPAVEIVTTPGGPRLRVRSPGGFRHVRLARVLMQLAA